MSRTSPQQVPLSQLILVLCLVQGGRFLNDEGQPWLEKIESQKVSTLNHIPSTNCAR